MKKYIFEREKLGGPEIDPSAYIMFVGINCKRPKTAVLKRDNFISLICWGEII